MKSYDQVFASSDIHVIAKSNWKESLSGGDILIPELLNMEEWVSPAPWKTVITLQPCHVMFTLGRLFIFFSFF